MTGKSIIKRILLGPTIRTLYVYCKTRYSYVNKISGYKNIECRQLNENDVGKIASIQDLPTEKHFFKMSGNEYCILGFYQKVPCGLSSMSFFPNFYFLKNKLEKDAAYIHYCYVNENYRGKSVYPTMLKELLEYGFEEKQISKVYIDTDKRNMASQRGILKVGFQKWANCYEIGWGNIIFIRIFRKTKN